MESPFKCIRYQEKVWRCSFLCLLNFAGTSRSSGGKIRERSCTCRFSQNLFPNRTLPRRSQLFMEIYGMEFSEKPQCKYSFQGLHCLIDRSHTAGNDHFPTMIGNMISLQILVPSYTHGRLGIPCYIPQKLKNQGSQMFTATLVSAKRHAACFQLVQIQSKLCGHSHG